MTGRQAGDSEQLDLFSVAPAEQVVHRLEAASWPPSQRFPINRPGKTVRNRLWGDLVASPQPLVVAGYASIAKLVDFAAAWEVHGHDGQVRVVFGSEPFGASRSSFGSPSRVCTNEATKYWNERGISLRLSAKVVLAPELLQQGRLKVRFVHGGPKRLHAKIYVGEAAATIGSSNVTTSGLSRQLESNARFEATEGPDRHERHRRCRPLVECHGREGPALVGDDHETVEPLGARCHATCSVQLRADLAASLVVPPTDPLPMTVTRRRWGPGR